MKDHSEDSERALVRAAASDIFIECSYNNKPEERATMFIQTALVPKRKFSIYCTERDDTIVIGLGSSK